MRAPLIDRFGRRHTYLRISVTDRCNLRCTYCMPEEGIALASHSDLLTFEEISRVLQIFAEMGINKVRLTGGEPLLRKGLPNLISSISQTSGIDKVGLTTNGILLTDYAEPLRNAGLKSVNISLDTLNQDRFLQITRVGRIEKVLEGIEAAIAGAFSPIKINMVVMKDFNDDEISDFIEYFFEKPVHLRFIEFMPFRSNGWNRQKLIPATAIRQIIGERFSFMPAGSEEPDQVARPYQIEGMKGSIGIISSMTEEFCESCSRLRLSATGGVKTCLFGPEDGNVRNLLRDGATDAEIETFIRQCLDRKPSGHQSFNEGEFLVESPMVAIGG
ncbi:GTP 3',8-cyclase MoaA [bacterium]|nr:GTP 3',8-cyclase MoaA [bacterium]